MVVLIDYCVDDDVVWLCLALFGFILLIVLPVCYAGYVWFNVICADLLYLICLVFDCIYVLWNDICCVFYIWMIYGLKMLLCLGSLF